MYQTLSALLLLGNISFTGDEDRSKVENREALAAAEEIIGSFGSGELEKNLVSRLAHAQGARVPALPSLDAPTATHAMLRADVMRRYLGCHGALVQDHAAWGWGEAPIGVLDRIQ